MKVGVLPRLRSSMQALAAALALAASLTLLAMASQAPAAHAQEPGAGKKVLIYTGTTGFRHSDAINQGRPIVQSRLEALGFEVDWENCDNMNLTSPQPNHCNHPNQNPRVFSDENLAQYDAIYLLNASSRQNGVARGNNVLWDEAQRGAIVRYLQNGGGIAANHNATDMGHTQVTWDWWDGPGRSVVGSVMPAHAQTNINNVAQVQTQDRNHLSTKDLPDNWGFGDEHYNFATNVRGKAHVLATLDERTYNVTGNPTGRQDHPISWCKIYDGESVEDGTGNPKPYEDGRTWVSGMGHFGASYSQNGGNNNFVNHIIGGIRWVAGEGLKSDCAGTDWSQFSRTTLVSNANTPIALDVSADGKVYWTDIGSQGPWPNFNSEGYIRMHDPEGPPNNQTTVIAIPTRADHGNSEDGVLGMSLEPGFDLSKDQKRDIYVYYSPRNPDWPTSGPATTLVGYNQISRFTLNEDGTGVVPGSEKVIMRIEKAKIVGSPAGFPGGPTNNGPGHVGGASLVFDSEGNLYIGVGDDVSPNAAGHNRYSPLDYRAAERWDARKTSANSNDLRGKIVRIKPLDKIHPKAQPGVGSTYEVPAGNMFEPGTPNTRPEIYAMGFRQPFTVHTDPANPGTIGVGEFCHDNPANQADRSPAGTCEWNLVSEPAFHGWPFCVGNNSQINTMWRWNYDTNSSTGEQYDCSASEIPSDLNWAPEGGNNPGPTNHGLDTIPGPAAQATIWNKYPGAAGGEAPLDFGDLNPGGKQPITGPFYRWSPGLAGVDGRFPRYYDGSWLIANRGSNGGFWKEVRLRSDNNEMLHVHDFIPDDRFGTSPRTSLVIGTRFGPDGALYLARFPVGCCRNNVNPNSTAQILKIEFDVEDPPPATPDGCKDGGYAEYGFPNQGICIEAVKAYWDSEESDE